MASSRMVEAAALTFAQRTRGLLAAAPAGVRAAAFLLRFSVCMVLHET